MTAKKQLQMDSDLAGVEKALKRAAKSARTLAHQTKTPCIVVKDGQIVDISKRQTKSEVVKHASVK